MTSVTKSGYPSFPVEEGDPFFSSCFRYNVYGSLKPSSSFNCKQCRRRFLTLARRDWATRRLSKLGVPVSGSVGKGNHLELSILTDELYVARSRSP